MLNFASFVVCTKRKNVTCLRNFYASSMSLTYTFYRWPLGHLKGDYEVIPTLRSLLTDMPPIPGKFGHTTGVYVPYSVRTVVWVLVSASRTRYVKVLWEGTNTVFRPNSRVMSNRLQMSLQKQHFLLFKDPGCWFGRVWTLNLPLSRPALSPLN